MGRIRSPISKGIAGALGALVLFASASLSPTIPAQAATNAVITENQQVGSSAWQLGSMVADDATGQIKGYASATSVNQNASVTLYVSVNPPQIYTIDVYRLGWYAGLGGRLRLHAGGLLGTHQQPCLPDPSSGVIACNWSPSYTWTIPSDWTSGIYVALLTNSVGYQNYVIFVVRDGRPAPILYQQSVTTYEAYNNYPDDHLTGKSLYSYNSHGAPTVANDVRAVKVSFDRPYTSEGAGQFFFFEVDFVRWLERAGYDVTYSTDIDTHANGAALRTAKAFLSVGHDEYWSKEMFDAAQAARDAGVNLGFFGADAIFWQVRFEASASGVPNRVMVCYKDASIDPIQGPTTTVTWRSAPVNRPEQSLIGVQFTGQVTWGSNAGYVVVNSTNWVYAGSGFKDGDVVPGIVGYELDRSMSTYPSPSSSQGQTLLSQSPVTTYDGRSDYSNSSIYQAASKAWVFAAGTISWSWGLDNFNASRADPRIQETTANILNTMAGAPPVVAATAVQPGTPASPTLLAALETSRLAYGLGVAP